MLSELTHTIHTHTHTHTHTVELRDLSAHVRTLYKLYRSAKRTSSLKSPDLRHTILFVLIISAYRSWQLWCPFIHRLRGEKVLTWTLVPWISCQRRESADAANCPRKKSQQRSEIKCRQLLLCFLELRPGFNISYLLPYLFIDNYDLTTLGSTRNEGKAQYKVSFHGLEFCQWLLHISEESL